MDAREKATPSYPRVVSKPVGGFRAISLLQVCMAWWAYRTGVLREYLDFRVYLALHEFDEQRLTARRVRAKNRMPSSPSRLSRALLVGEVRGLVASSSERLVRASLARLEANGLMAIGEAGIIFAAGPSHLKLDDADARVTKFQRACRSRQAGMRRLPVPRLILRHIARGAPPAVAATIMGHLVRSVRWMDKEIHVSGSCTAGFISDFFGVDLRSVRRARAHLDKIGWLVADVQSGSDVGGVPNLAWSPPSRHKEGCRATGACTDLSPRRPDSDIELSPPTYTSQLRSGSRYQQLPKPNLAVVERRDQESVPRLSNVLDADLSDPERTDQLFEEAVARGLVRRSESHRLNFFAAAERAKRVATQNAGGFFAAIVRRECWHVLKNVDEDRALCRIKELSEKRDWLLHSDRTPHDPTTETAPHTADEPVMTLVQSLVAKLGTRVV